MAASGRIHWRRALVAGVLAEIVVFALVIPVYLIFGEEAETQYAVAPASFAGPFLLALWVGRRIDSRFVLHGTIVGLVATLAFLAINAGQPQPAIYWMSHGLKILGGAAGGYVAMRCAATRRVAPAAGV
jgi:putative membrane protein (TIGR04086 family)